MSGQDHLGEAVNGVIHYAQVFANLYGSNTQGWLAKSLKRMCAELRAELGLFGLAIGGLISTAVYLFVWAIVTAMLFWATLGSMMVLITVPGLLFGPFNPPTNAIPVGVVFALINCLITVAAMGFIFHGVAHAQGAYSPIPISAIESSHASPIPSPAPFLSNNSINGETAFATKSSCHCSTTSKPSRSRRPSVMSSANHDQHCTSNR